MSKPRPRRSRTRPRRSRTRPHRSLAEAARGLTEASPKSHEASPKPHRGLKIRSVLSFSDSETFLESDLLPEPSKSTRQQVQFSRRHSVVLRLNDERVLSAGGKFNSVAMVDISILETRWKNSGDSPPERPQESLKEASRKLQKVPASTQKASASTQKAPAVLTRQRKKRLLLTYVQLTGTCTQPIVRIRSA